MHDLASLHSHRFGRRRLPQLVESLVGVEEPSQHATTTSFRWHSMRKHLSANVNRKTVHRRGSHALALAATGCVQKMRTLDPASAVQFMSVHETILFDCDGVLWKGAQLIPKAAEALHTFREQGKRLLFVTNNASKSRATYVQKFRSLGLQVDANEIVSASYAAAAYLQSIGFTKKVYLVGNTGVEEELQQHGIQFIGGEAMSLPFMGDMDAIKDLKVDPDIGAVVVGWDPRFSYERIVYAATCLREIPGCLFIATNTDCADSLGGQPPRMMPGTGALVAAVQVASGVSPLVVGKEGPWLLGHLKEAYGLQPERACMVGDRLDTDVAMGRAGGLATVLTLSGVCTLEDAEAAEAAGEGPDAVAASVAVLAGLQP